MALTIVTPTAMMKRRKIFHVSCACALWPHHQRAAGSFSALPRRLHDAGRKIFRRPGQPQPGATAGHTKGKRLLEASVGSLQTVRSSVERNAGPDGSTRQARRRTPLETTPPQKQPVGQSCWSWPGLSTPLCSTITFAWCHAPTAPVEAIYPGVVAARPPTGPAAEASHTPFR